MSYSIRLAMASDVPRLYEMAVAHYQASGYLFPVDEQYGLRFLHQQVQSPDACALVLLREDKAVGVLLGSSSPHPFLPVKIAVEILWWVDEDHRGWDSLELLKAFEYWAKNIKRCQIISCADVAQHSIAAIYERRGYKLEEQTWTKELN